jgi:cytochrome c-type biogenesis protein CcmH/NrfG
VGYEIPDQAYTMVALAESFRDEGKFDQAEYAFKTAIQIAPLFPEAHSGYAMLLYRQERYDEAEDQVRRALRDEPTEASFHLMLGNILDAQVKLAEAEAALSVAAALTRDYES